ncbi:hypothetical protein FRC14_005202 [Serendipita sp. 396]|nr:hypothetical protein FRC14_005202 [Serendipita sp. 396]KAG8788001.1 hypothetical protein FRC15_006812 [Serendipita sp. 397]KAG8802941.1 hypothetical protein FRC16_008271 [Serendipita sp. 398]KAG8810655.1 hypothetical protein FRC19_004384 [Serendipita sp. 401]KAG8872564.1 hypothetical protein FRC20_009415 [Serendipita sp. 405]KAG9056650.1 hypothetical protein FS842_010021 [Serendipita sp. 407]
MVLLSAPEEWLTSPPTARPTNPERDTIVLFYASIDPTTNQMWCGDCRKVKSTIDWLFNGDDKPPAYVIYVGQKAEWKKPAVNHFRTDWKIESVPTMIKFRAGEEVYRLVEEEILDSIELGKFFLA